jgi:hypothetical protein
VRLSCGLQTKHADIHRPAINDADAERVCMPLVVHPLADGPGRAVSSAPEYPFAANPAINPAYSGSWSQSIGLPHA